VAAGGSLVGCGGMSNGCVCVCVLTGTLKCGGGGFGGGFGGVPDVRGGEPDVAVGTSLVECGVMSSRCVCVPTGTLTSSGGDFGGVPDVCGGEPVVAAGGSLVGGGGMPCCQTQHPAVIPTCEVLYDGWSPGRVSTAAATVAALPELATETPAG
jgi:hypothetical protein